MSNQSHCREVWEDYHGKDQILTDLYKSPYDHLPIECAEQVIMLSITAGKLIATYAEKVKELPISDDVSKTQIWFELFGPCSSPKIGAALLCVFHGTISDIPNLACDDEEFSFTVLHYLLAALVNADDDI